MKFVHIADLHLGKVIHQFSLLEIQKQLLNDLLAYMKKDNIKVLVIAGDIYDRSIPPQEAVSIFDDFLTKAIMEEHIKILMISGNHDSHERLNFASTLLKKQGLHIETKVNKTIKPIDIEGVQFYLLPFFKPIVIKELFKDEDITTYQDALKVYLKHQNIDKTQKNVLITHQFVGKNSITSESEMTLSVGGSEIIDASLFDDFDYVALGHLHAPQKVSRETIRYSGSLMRYSFDEVNQQKSITIVDTDDFTISFYHLKPSIDVKQYQGTYYECMDENFIEKKDDLISLQLLDKQIVPHAIDHLRVIYPHLLQISYPYLLNEQQIIDHHISHIETMEIPKLFKKFYQYITNDELDERLEKTVTQLLDEGCENNETFKS